MGRAMSPETKHQIIGDISVIRALAIDLSSNRGISTGTRIEILCNEILEAIENKGGGGQWLQDGYMALPKDRREAECMVIVGQKFLEDPTWG